MRPILWSVIVLCLTVAGMMLIGMSYIIASHVSDGTITLTFGPIGENFKRDDSTILKLMTTGSSLFILPDGSSLFGYHPEIAELFWIGVAVSACSLVLARWVGRTFAEV